MNEKLPVRKRNRLQGFDYSQNGCYFITICTKDKKCIFGMQGNLSYYGQIAESELLELNNRYDYVNVVKYVVMPNHIHAIVEIENYTVGNAFMRSENIKSLSEIVGKYKAGVSRQIHQLGNSKLTVWQKSFYDEIIKNEEHYLNCWQYIDANPQRWEDDELYIESHRKYTFVP